MAEDIGKFVLWIFVMAVFAAIVITATIFEGYIICQGWEWFIIPLFGMAPLSLAVAVGLSALVGLLTHQYDPNVIKTDEKDSMVAVKSFGKFLLFMFTHPAFVWLIMWIAKEYV